MARRETKKAKSRKSFWFSVIYCLLCCCIGDYDADVMCRDMRYVDFSHPELPISICCDEHSADVVDELKLAYNENIEVLSSCDEDGSGDINVFVGDTFGYEFFVMTKLDPYRVDLFISEEMIQRDDVVDGLVQLVGRRLGVDGITLPQRCVDAGVDLMLKSPRIGG